MKKRNNPLNVLFILAIVFVNYSCQKPQDWECTCECKPTGGSSFTKSTPIENMKKSEAMSTCTDFGKAMVNGNGSWKCEIK